MKQLTQSEIRKNGKVYKNVSSPATEGTMKQVTDIVEKDGTFSISTDGGKTYSPAGGAVPEALPQEASALKNGDLPTSGWGQVAAPFWEGELYVGTSLTEVAPAGTVPEALRQDTNISNWSVKQAAVGWVMPYSHPSIEGANLKIPYSGSQNMYVYPDGSIYAQSVGSTYTYYGIKNKTYGKQTFAISDTSITANSDILMELTDDGGVKAYSMEAGKMTVIRDTVPTSPILYTYKVKQTNASGQFTLVNHFVPNIPVTSVNGQTGAVTIAVPTKTSQLQNDSNFATKTDIPTKTSQLTNDSNFATTSDIPTKTSQLTNDSGFVTKNNIVAGDNVTVTDENGNVKISATGGGSGGGGIGNWQNATLDTELDDGTYLIQMIPSITGQDAKVNTVLLTDGQSQQFAVLYRLIVEGLIQQQCAYFTSKKLYAKTASVLIFKNEQQINMEFSEENLNENYSGYKYIKII